MDKSKFTDATTGHLVQIDRIDHPEKRDWAFVPDELPAQFEVDSGLWQLISEARDRLGTLNGIGQTLPDPELLQRPLQNREAIASSKIEGTFVTPEQLLLYEMNPSEPTSSTAPSADWLEVSNYGDALRVGCDMTETAPMARLVMRSMHSVLMRGVRGRDKSPGKFRERQVQIGSTARYIPPPHTEINRLITNLEKHAEAPLEGVDPLVTCFVIHYQFEAIHPFEDGNGRLGRALLALMIRKLLRHTHPWLYMSDYYNKFEREYFDKMFDVSARGKWAEWLAFCLNGAITQANDAIARCHRFHRLQAEFRDKITAAAPTPRSLLLCDLLFKEPIVSITKVAAHFKTHYQTAKTDVEKLVEMGILKVLPNQPQKTFYSPDIIVTAYGESHD